MFHNYMLDFIKHWENTHLRELQFFYFQIMWYNTILELTLEGALPKTREAKFYLN